MSREILCRLDLGFKPENKERIIKKLKEFNIDKDNFIKEDNIWIELEVIDRDLTNEIEELKSLCLDISYSEYEIIDDSCFVWEENEEEEEDE